jgi:hypothetical protein
MHTPEPDTSRKSAPPPARSHFTMIPDMVGDLDLDPYTFRLYCQIRRVTGDAGNGRVDAACWQSTATLAAICRMSTGKVSQSKRKLVQQGLIRIEKRLGPGGYHDHITLVNIWPNNHRHFDRTPASPSDDELAPPSPGEEHAASVHQARTRLHPVNPMPSPSETIHIPLNQTSSSRNDDDDDENKGQEAKGENRKHPGDQKSEGDYLEEETQEGAHDETMDFVTALYRRELEHDPSPLQREEIAELVALCADPAVWRHAFLRSAPARSRWAYITQCIRNAAEERGACAAVPGAASDRGTVNPQPAPASPPPAPHVERWAQVLEVLSWKLTESVYRQGFARTTCVGERDGGKTWDVIVPRPAFLDWIQQPSHKPLVDKALQRCGFNNVTVNFIPPPAT